MGVLEVGGRFFARGFGWRRASATGRQASASGLRASAAGLAALFALGAAAAIGCGWTGTEHSVRFNRWHSERRFGRLPPLPFDARERTVPDYRREDEEREDWRPDDSAEKAEGLWARASEAGRSDDYAQLRKHLGEYLEAVDTDSGSYYGHPGNIRRRRNSARDRLDALDSLERGAHARAVGAYLAARSLYDDWVIALDTTSTVSAKDPRTNLDEWRAGPGGGHSNEAAKPPDEAAKQDAPAAGDADPLAALGGALGAALDAVPRDPGIVDNVEYLRAALLFERGEWRESVEAFERLAVRYPKSEKREAALFNAGLLWMKGSRGGWTGEHAMLKEPCADCEDEEWGRAVGTFGRLLREYPKGRYAGDARGWLAYLHVRVGETAGGLVEYYRMLADERDAAARAEALRSLPLVRPSATEAEMARVESVLEAEPRVALAYAYHEIYNAALDDGFDVEVPEEASPYRWCRNLAGERGCLREHYDWAEKERERRTRVAGSVAFERVASFATRLMRRLPGSAVGGGFALRVAQAQLELGNDGAARELAARALSARLAGNERASALWVRGVAEYRLGEFDAARRTFESLLAEFPEGDLSEGARRYVAMAAEEAGDLEGALEQYFVLEYEDDVAYFVDVLLTPEQLASFAERQRDPRARAMLLYSLGVRHMRAHRFGEARAAFARVRTNEGAVGHVYPYDGECGKSYSPPHCSDVKNTGWEDPKGVRAEWVLRDLKTMEEIEHLEERLSLASGDEQKAEALYQLASYLYESGDLTFYNPAVWRGGRFYAFYYDQQFRAPGEAALMRRYMEEHEPLVRALRLYLRVSEEHPRTRAARDSLYTAAVIHERLAGFDLYWPRQYELRLYPAGRLVTYKDVRRAYPDYRLPAGTYDWEPSTRTVNGHTAWPAPPRPRRLTGVERARLKIKRAERRVAQAWGLFGEVYGGRVRGWMVAGLRWSLVALVAAVVLSVFRRTRRARRFLYRRLAPRRRAPAAKAVYAPKSSYAAHSSYEWGEGVRAAGARVAGGLFRLTLHERGRAALALNLFTHGLLTVLLWAVLWAAGK